MGMQASKVVPSWVSRRERGVELDHRRKVVRDITYEESAGQHLKAPFHEGPREQVETMAEPEAAMAPTAAKEMRSEYRV